MADILVHPWLDGNTPGITYVPAPPISELAQPLPSALHIDRDLFESLCIIWGRHADLDSIQTDLLSPPGQGTLAKAFYFLLQKHREMTMEEHGILMDIEEVLNTQGKIITKHYAAPRSKPTGRRSLEAALSSATIPVPKYLRPDRPAPAPPTRSPSPSAAAPVTSTTSEAERPSSRSRPSSPLGPRPLKSRLPIGRSSGTNPPRATSPPPLFVPSPDTSRARSQTVDSVLEPREKSVIGSPSRARQPSPSQHTVPLVEALSSIRPRSSTTHTRSARAPPGVIHAPTPVSAANSPMSPLLDREDIDMRDRTQDRAHAYTATDPSQVIESRRTLGQVSMLQPRIQRAEHRPSLDEVAARRPAHSGWSAPEHRLESSWAKAPGSENKENRATASSARAVQHDPTCHSGGLGFGHSVPMAKEMGNMLFINDSTNGQQPQQQGGGSKKEKKSRRK